MILLKLLGDVLTIILVCILLLLVLDIKELAFYLMVYMIKFCWFGLNKFFFKGVYVELELFLLYFLLLNFLKSENFFGDSTY